MNSSGITFIIFGSATIIATGSEYLDFGYVKLGGINLTVILFLAMAVNKDGKISRAEYAHSGWTMFTRHDYTNDGAISAKDDVEPRPST